MSLYMVVQIVNLTLNAILLAIAVEYFHLDSFVGQVLVNILIAIWSYFIYNRYVFRKT